MPRYRSALSATSRLLAKVICGAGGERENDYRRVSRGPAKIGLRAAFAFVLLTVLVLTLQTPANSGPSAGPKQSPAAATGPAGPPAAASGGSGQIVSPPSMIIPSVFKTFYVVAQGNDPLLTMPLSYLVADRFQGQWNSLKLAPSLMPYPYDANQKDPAYQEFFQSTFSLANPLGIAVIPEPTWTADTLAARCENDPSMLGGAIVTYNDATVDYYYLVWANEFTRSDETFQVILCSNLIPVLYYSGYIAPTHWAQWEFPLGPIAALAAFAVTANSSSATSSTSTTSVSKSVLVNGARRVEYAFEPSVGTPVNSVLTHPTAPPKQTTTTTNTGLPFWALAALTLVGSGQSVNIIGYNPPKRAFHLAQRIADLLPDVSRTLCLYPAAAPSVAPSGTPSAAPSATQSPTDGYDASPYGELLDNFWIKRVYNEDSARDETDANASKWILNEWRTKKDAYLLIPSPSPSPLPPPQITRSNGALSNGKTWSHSWTDNPGTPLPSPTPLHRPVADFCRSLYRPPSSPQP